ncbi:MAG: hypothetical protein KKB37_01510 [Alphaproteobacteria bacterium]|nr:hypothetical protein [Alphaproteobacteria bacterium]
MFGTKTIAAIAVATAIAGLGIQSASAAERGYGYGYSGDTKQIEYRIAQQARRIWHGEQSGQLSWAESRRAHMELSQIRGYSKKYLYDGRLSTYEKRHLDRLLDENSYRINRFASNGRGGLLKRWRAARYDEDKRSRLNGFR